MKNLKTTTNDCTDLLREGLYKKIQIDRNGSFNMKFREYLLSEKFKEDYHKGVWEGGVDILGIVNLGANADDEEIKIFQEKISHITEMQIDQSFYENLNFMVPSIALAKEYNECKKINTQGLTIDTNIGDKKVVFTLKYYKRYDDDLYPEVQSFAITNETVPAKDIRGIWDSKILDEETIVSCIRNNKEDLIFTLDTTKEAITLRIPAKRITPTPPPIKKVLYGVHISHADNQFIIRDNANNQEIYNTGRIDQDPPLDITVYLILKAFPAINSFQMIGLNADWIYGDNPYNFKIRAYKAQKIDGKIVEETINNFNRQGSAGVGIVMNDPLIISMPKGEICVNNPTEL